MGLHFSWTRKVMTFKEAKIRLIGDLETGSFLIGPRATLKGKNLLATGEKTARDVAEILKACRGNQYTCIQDERGAGRDVHVFEPVSGREKWYVKATFRADADGEFSVVISVHLSEFKKRG